VTRCNICTSAVNEFAVGRILAKYDVKYYQCSRCGHIQTEKPFWLDEAYANPITNSDIGLISRNLMFSRITKSVIHYFFNSEGRFLDYGGGYGMFVRLMRDNGYDFYLSDKYSKNLFAEGFERPILRDERYELVTAFELLEHLHDPYREIGEILQVTGNILVSTKLLPHNNPKPGQWWYYGLDHGQHVSFYTLRSLTEFANKLGVHLLSDGDSIHLFTKNKINSLLYRLCVSGKVAKVIDLFLHRTSYLARDYENLTGLRIG
jgi:hypothetical protein